MLLMFVLFACHLAQRERTSSVLSDYALAGPRGPGCIRLALLTDQSASMQRYTAPRDAALRRILDWTPGQLRDDDQITAVDWATSAAALLPTQRVDHLAGSSVGSTKIDAQSSELLPGLRTLAADSVHPCRTIVVVISDGLLSERGQGSEIQLLLTTASADSVVLLRPSKKLEVPREWKDQLPYASSVAVDGDDPDAVALALGRVLTKMTGQKLVERLHR